MVFLKMEVNNIVRKIRIKKNVKYKFWLENYECIIWKCCKFLDFIVSVRFSLWEFWYMFCLLFNVWYVRVWNLWKWMIVVMNVILLNYCNMDLVNVVVENMYDCDFIFNFKMIGYRKRVINLF